MTTSIPSKTTVSYDSVKLGIDAHAKYYWVSRQLDGATPQPVQKMTYDELLLFVVKQQKLTPNLVTCYEAGETRKGQALWYFYTISKRDLRHNVTLG
jgi:hypothetical protein